MKRIGWEMAAFSQWLYAGMKEAGLAVELLETRHVRMRSEAVRAYGTDRISDGPQPLYLRSQLRMTP
jgi:transposase